MNNYTIFKIEYIRLRNYRDIFLYGLRELYLLLPQLIFTTM